MWSNADGQPFPGDMFLTWLPYVLSLPNIPQTINTSYDANEKAISWE